MSAGAPLSQICLPLARAGVWGELPPGLGRVGAVAPGDALVSSPVRDVARRVPVQARGVYGRDSPPPQATLTA